MAFVAKRRRRALVRALLAASCVASAVYLWNAFLARALEPPTGALPPAHTVGLAFRYSANSDSNSNSNDPPAASSFGATRSSNAADGGAVGLEERAGRVPPGVRTVALLGSFFGAGAGWRAIIPGDGFASCTQARASRCVFTSDASRADAVVAHNFDVLYPWTLLAIARLLANRRCSYPFSSLLISHHITSPSRV